VTVLSLAAFSAECLEAAFALVPTRHSAVTEGRDGDARSWNTITTAALPSTSMMQQIPDSLQSAWTDMSDTDRLVMEKALDFCRERAPTASSFDHAVGAAGVVSDMKLDAASIVSAILHGTTGAAVSSSSDHANANDNHNTPAAGFNDTLRNDIRQEFGQDISLLVTGVAQIGAFRFRRSRSHRGSNQQAEHFRGLLLAVAQDIRVVLIKLADQTHALRQQQQQQQQRRILDADGDSEILSLAAETLDLYAPLAHRLGIFSLKMELEETCFRILHPNDHRDLEIRVATEQEKGREYTEDVVAFLRDRLGQANAQSGMGESSEVTGRAKHLYSIYKKMDSQKKDFEEIQDLVAFRVLVDTVGECYQALGVVHGMWKPVEGRFKDYIANPKSNGYQSLHTTVLGPEDRRIEVQIRTRDMHQVADEGGAAHWMYKSSSGSKKGGSDEEDARRYAWLRQLVEWAQHLDDPAALDHEEDHNDLVPSNAGEEQNGLFEKEVFVFSPQGHLFALSNGSSVLDFAYHIHTDLGSHCIGARVNGKMVPLKHQIENGDTIEVIQSLQQTPHRDWLDIVHTSKARSRIKSWIKSQQRDQSIAMGKELFDREVKKFTTYHQDTHASKNENNKAKMERVLTFFKVEDEEHLFTALANGQIAAPTAVRTFFDASDRPQKTPTKDDVSTETFHIPPPVEMPSGSNGVLAGGARNMLIRFCRHCNPLNGEAIQGMISQGQGIKVHRMDCRYLLESDPERRIETVWDELVFATNNNKAMPKRPVRLEVILEDAHGILASTSKVISSLGINIRSVILKPMSNGCGLAIFELMLASVEDLNKVTRQLQLEEGVIRIARR